MVLLPELLNVGPVMHSVEGLQLPMKSGGTKQTKALLGGLKPLFLLLCAVRKFVGFRGREVFRGAELCHATNSAADARLVMAAHRGAECLYRWGVNRWLSDQ